MTLSQSVSFFLNNYPNALMFQICSVIKLYMFQASALPIIRSFLLYIRHRWVSCWILMTVSKQSQELSSIATLLGNGHQNPAWNSTVPNVQ
jgi:hypothetical protein